MADAAKKLERGAEKPRKTADPGRKGLAHAAPRPVSDEEPISEEGPRLVRGKDARHAAERLRPEETEREPEVIPEEQRGLEERRVDTRLEGLSGMGAALGEVSEDKDQLGHLERQGLRREEQGQIERTLEVEANQRLPDTEADRSLEPRENKGMR